MAGGSPSFGRLWPGATNFEMLDHLDKWADKGVAPERVIASHITSGAVSPSGQTVWS